MDSPYQPQPPAMPPQPPPGVVAPIPKPASIQIFGILDLVIAILGLLGAMMALAAPITAKMLGGGSASRGNPALEAKLQAMQSGAWINPLAGVISAIIGVLLLLAGIQLLQGRRQALQWSNRYAWTAIGSKLVVLVLTVVFVLPAMQAGIESMDPGMRGPMQIGVAGVTVLSGLAGMIYPVLCLAFLNRPPVKEWLAAYGSS